MPSHKKTGRPRKIDEKVVGKLIEGFQNDFTVEEACRFAGIHKDTYYEECKRNPSFADEMGRAQDFPFIVAKHRVFRGMKQPGPEAANLVLKFLERRQRDRYSPKIIEEHTGEVTLGYGEIESAPKAKSPKEARRLAE